MEQRHIYVNGDWRRSAAQEVVQVTNPATEEIIGSAPAGCQQDIENAVHAANGALETWRTTSRGERVAALDRIRQGLEARAEEAAGLITAEMGAPLWLSRSAQVGGAIASLDRVARTMESLPEDEVIGSTLVLRDPVGVVGAITPWNFPLYQIVAKVAPAPALAAGCSVVLKPSELTPFDAGLLADVIHEAQLPPGVFNLVFGTGSAVGAAIASHPMVDMVSFTGSTQTGRRVAALSAQSIKRLTLELGGKSANIVLPDADLGLAMKTALRHGWLNSGQVCASLSRLLVHRSQIKEAEALLCELAQEWQVGDPQNEGTMLGPLASAAQRTKVLGLIASGVEEGARVLIGGLGRPSHLDRGAYVLPTILGGVHNEMRVAREEVFGPVICLIEYGNEDEAVAIANDSEYGLAGCVWSTDLAKATVVARRLQTGQVSINGSAGSSDAPFGGVKQSGLGREGGRYGIEEFMQLKSLNGAA
ncbi:aldehyde dehydrogenase family protein [Burkholderia pyrrocinia]|uniref:aldehyde dehydrogenase family protein n=1 Tax=Burkholderia pyrrocinia TaxID=60550 RepID=UPI002AB0C600|nr:aldehyde dehydrogenase family protein [Burkholderia pyrrocinia]